MQISISKLALAAVLALGACAGDSPDPVDRRCTKSLYEPCITEHDCMNEYCREFTAEGYTICTQNCDANNPCPDLGDMKATCTSENVCKPPVQIDCEVIE